ncbi:hypothetical protein ACO0QE_002699 [Hanseniaspora vineae]
MTSAHRSQLEARNGGKNTVKTNIKHSRLLPSHKTIKYRSDYKKEEEIPEQGSFIELDEQEVCKAKQLIESVNSKGSAAKDPVLAQHRLTQEPATLISTDEIKNQDASSAGSNGPILTALSPQPSTDKSSWRKKAVFNKSSNKVNKQSHSSNLDSRSQKNANSERHKRQEFLKKVVR